MPLPRDPKQRFTLDILRAMETERPRIESLAHDIGDLLVISGRSPLQCLCALIVAVHSLTAAHANEVFTAELLHEVVTEILLAKKRRPPKELA